MTLNDKIAWEIPIAFAIITGYRLMENSKQIKQDIESKKL